MCEWSLGVESVALLLERVDAALVVDHQLGLVVDGHVHVEGQDRAVMVDPV